VPVVRLIALSQSLPTPNTQDPFRVVVSETDGAPEEALFPFVLPIAPEPLVPLVSAPVNVTRVMDAATLCDRVALTVTAESEAEAKARQISAVPIWPFVRLTSAQVTPAPLTPVTLMPEELASVETNASSSSFPDFVENEGEVMLVLWLERSVEVIVSVARAANADCASKKTIESTKRHAFGQATRAVVRGGACFDMALRVLSFFFPPNEELNYNWG
jgi:hypothetical protein